MAFRWKSASGWLVAVSVIVSAGLASAQCPPEGKRLIQVMTTALGTYDVYVFGGPSTLQGGVCVLTSKFLPHNPVAATHDRNGNHFFTGEYSRGVVKLPASSYGCESGCPATVAGLREVIDFPVHPDPSLRPFTLDWFGHTLQSEVSAWTVGTVATPGMTAAGDRIWVPQAGQYWTYPTAIVRVGGANIPVTAWENHGRLVAYDTSTSQIMVVNLPGDWNQVLSPMWDAAQNRLWFVEAGVDFNRPRLGHFDPDQLNPAVIGGAEDFLDPAKREAAVCKPGQPEATCIKYYDLPPMVSYLNFPPQLATTGVNMPIFIARGGDGRVWVAGHASGNLLSVEPTSGLIDIYPLARDNPNEPLGRGPFQMVVSPEGLLYFSQGAAKIGVIDTWTAPTTAACKALNPAQQNPCVQEFDVLAAYNAQNPGTVGQVGFAMNTIFIDAADDDVLWFGGGSSLNTLNSPAAGYLERSTGAIHFLPALAEIVYDQVPNPGRFFPEQQLWLHPADGEDLWVTDYAGSQVYLLKKRAG